MMTKQEIYDEVHKLEPICRDACQFIWNHPETGGEEDESSEYMKKLLDAEGFVIVSEEKVPHAFYAEYGSGKPVVAVLGEYDALPNLSQKVSPEKDPVVPGGAGHGCGHNLLGSAAATAAVAIKRFLEAEGISGTVRFYGCPEEELLCGKVKMAYYGMFNDCDLALSWHPMSANEVFDGGYLASASARFHFKGRTSHAAFAPEKGRSALDAVELMNVGVNYLREHVIDLARIHYTTDSGGFSPNIVPDKAGSWYYVRAPYMSDVKEILERIRKISEGAALMTETESSMKIEYGCCEMRENIRFADLTYENLLEAPKPAYTDDELAFAKALQEKVESSILERDQRLYEAEGMHMHTGICSRHRCEKTPLTASTDSGDVSYIMPMNLFTTACWPVGIAPHTWQAAAANGSSLGEKGALYAAHVIAGTAYDLYTKPGLADEIKEEFKKKNTDYSPMYSI